MEKSIMLMLVFCGLCIARSQGLQCYQCANVELKSGIDPFKGKSDPSCGIYPTSKNTVMCGFNEVCGSLSGEVSVWGLFDVKAQIRGCIPSYNTDTGPYLGCASPNKFSKNVINKLISIITDIPGIKFDGTACACNFEYCTLCEGGIEIAGYCFPYWSVAVISLGVLFIIILLISCCCCCCGCCSTCCRKRTQGPYSTPYRSLTVIQTPSQSSNSLSVQSGDITRPPANQGVAFAGTDTGLVVDQERAGYNQTNDPVGPAWA